MRVFVTGATGFIGSALIPELLGAGHTVLGMARTTEAAHKLEQAGADAHLGTLDDLDSLRAGASQADAVIHLAFSHDFSKIAANCEQDRQAIEALGDALTGTGKPLIGTAGVIVQNPVPGHTFSEDDPKPAGGFPRVSEEATLATVDKGVRGIVMRLSQIHDTHRQGLVSFLIQVALQTGVSAYVGEGTSRWAAAHLTDTVRLYRLALEKAEAGTKWHAVAEQGITSKQIAEALGQRLNLPVRSITPEEGVTHFGFLGHFMTLDSPSANEKTKRLLGWEPTGPTLLDDLAALELPAEL